MKKIIFIPTWRCQLNCSYCDYGKIPLDAVNGYQMKAFDKVHRVGRELQWEEWIKYLDNLEPYLLEMTGGEPTCYADLDKLLLHIGSQSKWAITSNTLNKEMIEKLPTHNCLAWTASYHFHSDTDFLKNLFKLKMKSVNVRITVVITPENYREAFKNVLQFANDFGVNMHPVLKQGFSWEESGNMHIWGQAEEIAASKDNIHFVRTISKHWQPEHHDVCSAGRDYFCLTPDGTVLRCYSHILTHKNEGHIKDFIPHETARACAIDCMFPCDREIAKKGA